MSRAVRLAGDYAAAAKCESAAIDLWIFFIHFVRYLDLWATRRTERSTIVDLLIKIPGPLNPAAYRKVQTKFKRAKICQKRSKISNTLPPPPWKFDKNIPVLCLNGTLPCIDFMDLIMGDILGEHTRPNSSTEPLVWRRRRRRRRGRRLLLNKNLAGLFIVRRVFL